MCGSFLLHPEQGDTFCPNCEVRVSPRQEFCHECDVPLKGGKVAQDVSGPAAEPAASAPQPAAAAGTPSWLIGLLVGAGIIAIILLVLLFTRGTTPPPSPPVAPKAEAPAPAPAPTPAPTAPAASAPPAAPTAPPAPAATDLKQDLQSVLSTLRDAQLRKDIVLFMSAYSLTFPGLDDKRAKTSKSWENFDFTNLVFTVDKIQPIDPDNAVATVTWYIDTRNRRNQELTSTSQTYQVRFAKELGKWRIRSLDEAEK
jgi:hypothetical protein